MYWIIFLALSFLCTILNPYVGLFGILFIAEFAIYWFLDDNIQKAAKFTASYLKESESKYYDLFKKSGKGVLNLWCALSVLFFGLMTAVSLVVWVFASGVITGKARAMTPFVLLGEEHRVLYGSILLIASIVFHLITTVMIFMRRSEILKMPKDLKPWKTLIIKEEHPSNNLDNVKIRFGFLSLFFILLAGIFGMTNGHFGWLSLILHFMYLIQLVFIEFIVMVVLRLIRKNATVRQGAQYFVNYVLDGTPYYYFIVGVVWTVTAVLVILQMFLTLSYKNDIFMIFSLDWGVKAMAVSCASEVFSALFITKNVVNKKSATKVQ